ncbi:lipolysis-stimulated lipoprotein receptor [Microcaecilia unicolor]|uniref:Lipolysis-stimulated lipoprotein receptor n=1 Tax=Microcaecilia unicolor TaxID=1415580 RepID=A0A6P7YXG4_9AMPH|nr:lipolysis-stimulated lipoprotein receptor [Microcaecilia unicolor]
MGAPGHIAPLLRWSVRRRLALLYLCCLLPGLSCGIQVTISNSFNVVILFQPITLQCTYETTAQQPPTVIWKYKSFCRNRITDAFSSSSQNAQINAQLQQSNPGYNPYVDCQDSVRTVRTVATKLGSAVTLGDFYQGRKITITNNAELSIEQTAWGDSGVYYCSVISNQDLQGNNEAYAELLVLGRESGISELLPDFEIEHMEVFIVNDALVASSITDVLNKSMPLAKDVWYRNSLLLFLVRSGYRIQANQQDDSMRVLYYMEKELANFDPSRPGASNSKFEKASAMSEISSLHEGDQRNNFRKGLGQLRSQAMMPIRDIEEESLLSSETRRIEPPRPDRYEDRYHGGGGRECGRRPRTRSMDDLDDLERPGHNYYRDQNFDGRDRGRRNSDDRSGYDYDRRHREHSPDSRDEYYGTRRSRSRDDLRDLDHSRHHRLDYDDRFLEDVLRRKQRLGSREDLDNASSSTARSGRRNKDNDFPPPPPPYTETESLSSSGRNDRKLKKNALSRESLVV